MKAPLRGCALQGQRRALRGEREDQGGISIEEGGGVGGLRESKLQEICANEKSRKLDQIRLPATKSPGWHLSVHEGSSQKEMEELEEKNQ